jgi:hypothetical protein
MVFSEPKYSPPQIMSGGSTRISLGLFSVFFGLGLFILIRGEANDTFSGILVCLIALMQLFDYGIWHNMECYPGGPNDRATRGIYLLLWSMPAILSFAAAFFGTNLFADPASRTFLIGVGAVFALLALIIITLVYEHKDTWCTIPGNLWQPNYGFLHDSKVYLKPNILLAIGILLPILLVDPWLLGGGTGIIALISYGISRNFDPYFNGEWLSVNTLLMNGVAIWAFLVPAIRRDLLGVNGSY